MKSTSQKRRWIYLVKWTLGILLFLSIRQFCEKRTDGFWLQKLFSSDPTPSPLWDIPPLNDVERSHLDQALNQPFYFLGMGSECFTFLSQDKKTVIKFFKLDQMRFVYFKRAWAKEDHSALAVNSHWLNTLPLPSFLDPYRKRVVGIRQFRIENTFNSCKIAWDYLREETGLVYLHLNPTTDLKKQLVVYDKIGIRYEIDLDSTRFVIQKRAELVTPKLKTLFREGKIEQAKECIDSLINLILDRCQKGIADRDPIIKQNFGFIGKKAVEIDTGSFSLNESMKIPFTHKRELYFETRELHDWLRTQAPSLADYLEERVNAVLCSIDDPAYYETGLE
jgi:hypothetical protein